RIEAEVLALESAISDQRRIVSGTVRFTSSEIFANWTAAAFLRSFRQRYPAVTVEVISDDRRLYLARRAADVALTAGSPPEGGGMVAQRLPNIAWGAYCSRAYEEEHGVPADVGELAHHAIVGLDGPMARIPQFLWLMRNVPAPRLSTCSNSLTNL